MTANKDQQMLDYVEENILQPGEEIVWKGRPDPKKGATVGIYKFLFGIPFLGFAIFWTVSAAETGWFALFGLPFMAIGLWMLSGPVRNYLRASRSYYAITDNRILILTSGNSLKVNTLMAGDINAYERTDKGDGSGSIRLRKTITPGNRDGGPTESVEFEDGLWGIFDVKGAAAAIGALRAEA